MTAEWKSRSSRKQHHKKLRSIGLQSWLWHCHFRLATKQSRRHGTAIKPLRENSVLERHIPAQPFPSRTEHNAATQYEWVARSRFETWVSPRNYSHSSAHFIFLEGSHAYRCSGHDDKGHCRFTSTTPAREPSLLRE
jgi:hypothetical protein